MEVIRRLEDARDEVKATITALAEEMDEADKVRNNDRAQVCEDGMEDLRGIAQQLTNVLNRLRVALEKTQAHSEGHR